MMEEENRRLREELLVTRERLLQTREELGSTRDELSMALFELQTTQEELEMAREKVEAEETQVDGLRRRLAEVQQDLVASMRVEPPAEEEVGEVGEVGENGALLQAANRTIRELTASLQEAHEWRTEHVCGETWESQTVRELVAETLQLERSLHRMHEYTGDLEAKLEHTCALLLSANKSAAATRDDANARVARLTSIVTELDSEVSTLAQENAMLERGVGEKERVWRGRVEELEAAVALLSERYDAVVGERNVLIQSAQRVASAASVASVAQRA